MTIRLHRGDLPDLARYNLTGRAALTGASAQVHWSRSRGVVFSGSDMAMPPADTTYQLWLLVRGGAVSAATFVPDQSGAATVAALPPDGDRPGSGAVFGAIVTLEPRSGSATPSGVALLARAPVAPASPVPALQ